MTDNVEVALDEFQSTHPVWGETYRSIQYPIRRFYFNPLTPCGVRPCVEKISPVPVGFQSTHPVWGETIKFAGMTGKPADFNPLTPCGVRLQKIQRKHAHFYFNPLTPCGVRPCERLLII